MKTISMTKLTDLINQKNPKVKARFCMSGGNCGTIYLGENDKEGNAIMAVGPSIYSLDEGFFPEVCWGSDRDETIVFFYNGTEQDFTEENLSNLILADYEKVEAETMVYPDVMEVFYEVKKQAPKGFSISYEYPNFIGVSHKSWNDDQLIFIGDVNGYFGFNDQFAEVVGDMEDIYEPEEIAKSFWGQISNLYPKK